VAVGFLAPGTGAHLGPYKRPSAQEVAGIFGTWLDLDVKPPDGAPSIEAALEVAHAIADPTITALSGHGLHAWYLFDQPWLFADDDERRDAENLAWRWQERHREIADFHIDPTHDLARLLRVPGTVNTKDAS
jgi:putative DNA primase/helicase